MKMLMKHVCLVVFIVFLKSKVWSEETPKIDCQGEEMAVQHLDSYYDWLYRLPRYLFPGFYDKTLVCVMNEKQRRKVCAQVAKFCYFKHKEQVTAEEIIEEIAAEGKCQKLDFEYKKSGGSRYKMSRKRMFSCPLVSKWGDQMKDVYISASNELNTILVFEKVNVEIRLVHVVRNLNFETNEKPKKLVPVEIKDKPQKVIPARQTSKPKELKPVPQANQTPVQSQ